jgi:Uncharacterized protein conserved in bacteria
MDTNRGWRVCCAVVALVFALGAGVSAKGGEGRVEADEVKRRDYYSLTIYSENDLYVTGTSTDRYYTTGQKATVVSEELEGFEEWFRQRWAQVLAEMATRKAGRNTQVRQMPQDPGPRMARSEQPTQYRVALTLGHNIYTPEDIKNPEPIDDDRPYAAWLYVGVALQARSTLEGTWAKLSVWHVDLGMVGPAAIGKEVQDFVHDHISGSPRAQGWAHQLKNEPGLNFVYQHKIRWSPEASEKGRNFDAIGHAGFSLGNVATFANAGFTLRGGFHLPDDFGNDLIRPGSETSQVGGHAPAWGLHAFAGADVRAVGRDIFLDGNTFRESRSIAKEGVVANYSFGVTANFRGWVLTVAQVFRTPEFKAQRGPQVYGAVTLTAPLGRGR